MDLERTLRTGEKVTLKRPLGERMYKEGEFFALLEAANHGRVKKQRLENWLLIAFGGYCGARLGEVAEIRKSDIDLKNKRVMLINEKKRKNERGTVRYLKLNPAMVERLKEFIRDLGPDDYLFKSHKDRLRARVKTLCHNNKIPYRGFHGLRHRFATHELLVVGDPFRVKAMTGHKTIQSLETYIHFIEETEEAPRV